MRSRPAGYCVVGVGNHAKTKLIPAIVASGHELRGLVSRQSATAFAAAPAFATIEAAAAALPLDTIFVIASPPSLHFAQAMDALALKRDVIVEKPAFVTPDQARVAAETAMRQGAILVEAFMHRHTQLFHRLLGEWPTLRPDATAIDIVFIVPGLPGGTFRASLELAASVLYDIGCYAVSLVCDLGLSLDGLALAALERPNGADELLRIVGRSGGLELSITVGVGDGYENSVTLTRWDASSVRYAPFFFGRPGERIVTVTGASGTQERASIESNAFEAMFSTPRERWATDQPQRLRAMIAVTACLARLGEDLLIRRRGL